MEIIVDKIFNTGKKYMQVLIALLILIHLGAGFSLIINPAEVNLWIIRIVGLTWMLGGLLIGMQWASLCAAKWTKEVEEEKDRD